MTRFLTLACAALLGVLILSGGTSRPIDAWAFAPEDPEGR